MNGIRLVERLSRAYRQTAEGEQVRDRAKEIETRIRRIARLARSVDCSRTADAINVHNMLCFLAPRMLNWAHIGHDKGELTD